MAFRALFLRFTPLSDQLKKIKTLEQIEVTNIDEILALPHGRTQYAELLRAKLSYYDLQKWSRAKMKKNAEEHSNPRLRKGGEIVRETKIEPGIDKGRQIILQVIELRCFLSRPNAT